ncbi:2-oxoglutarate and iron-dependent oxygenase domain-containing protein 3 isoform X1 [Oryctolagus cuniculus]|uniref:2-oxoglutarate and iron-dependent oxygenase domain-containing protein 3 isoform X1 n=1 Tax=Oryctolagus cuniculus TaxID=9986 RepID=UPI0022328B0B|nr:2-oxoglutarate and iron-dependent oxygenase domain-containing protein 3 isoform X2 [Oryctolagus cuniculus]
MAPQRRGAPRAPDGSTAAERRRPSSTKKDRALREVPGACLRTAGLGAGLALAALLLWSSLGTDDGVTEVLARRGELVAGRFVEVPCSEDYDGHRRFEECSVLLDVFSVSQSQPSTDGWVFRGGIRLFIGGNASGPNQGKTASASTEELPGGAALDRIPREDEPTSVAWALCPHRLFPGPPAFKTVFGCTPRKCGRGVSDVVITREEAQRIRSIAEKGLSLGGSHGGASILDLHSGALSVGKHFVNLYRYFGDKIQNIFSDEDFQLYRAVRQKVQLAIAEAFGISASSLYLTKPTFFSRINSTEAQTAHDEYWHTHVDKVTYGSFDYTSLLYLSDYLEDFGGGRFVFVEEGANKTVEPRAGDSNQNSMAAGPSPQGGHSRGAADLCAPSARPRAAGVAHGGRHSVGTCETQTQTTAGHWVPSMTATDRTRPPGQRSCQDRAWAAGPWGISRSPSCGRFQLEPAGTQGSAGNRRDLALLAAPGQRGLWPRSSAGARTGPVSEQRSRLPVCPPLPWSQAARLPTGGLTQQRGPGPCGRRGRGRWAPGKRGLRP